MANEAQKQDPALLDALRRWSDKLGAPLESREFAVQMDMMDPVKDGRTRFQIPSMADLPCVDLEQVDNPEEECVYMCGNSLGLKPKKADSYELEVMNTWGKMGVFMHFNGRFPAAECDLLVKDSLAKLVGAHPDEVACMNGLSVNMHLLLLSFYRPTASRYKILIEEHAFPSDRYGVVSQLNMHGHTEEDGLIIVKSRPGEETLRLEDILSTIEEYGDSIAVVFLSGVHYYTGQRFDIETITRIGHEKGCIVGWDLAHAIGNVALNLHAWEVDFACWCSYKYLNSGAGGIAGAFVHRSQNGRPKLNGWWSNREDTRFEMRHELDTAPGADAYRLSNPPPFLVALHQASLEIFDEIGMDRLLEKQYLLTGYLEYLIDHLSPSSDLVKIITPRDPRKRGAQLSLVFSISLKDVHEQLEKRGIVCDVRLPSVMRVAPAPAYTSFADVHRFFTTLRQVLRIES